MPKVQGLILDSRRTMLLAVLAAAVLLPLTGCTSGNVADHAARDAEIYENVIIELSDQFRVTDPIEDREPVLYLESFAADGVSLETQVAITAAFLDVYDVRFIDEREEAVDDDVAELPVRRGGVLVGLGPIVENETVTVRAELYFDSGDMRGFLYTLVKPLDRWETVGFPEPVTPQGFVE